jgi:LsmAD domain/Ataxin 2 SM domain
MSQPRGAWATQPAVVTAARKESSEKAYMNSCRDRFIAFTKTLMGEHVEVQLRNGTVPQTVEGILHVCSLGDRADGAFDIVLRLPSSQTRHISSSHIVQLTSRSYPVGERKRGGEFATDTDISGRPNAGRVRDLEAVDSSWFTGPAVDDGLGGNNGINSTFHQDDGLNGKGRGGGGGRKWDQFEANKRLFNVTSTFDENLYTTPLDRSKVTSLQQRTAERIAMEIESGMSANSHMREERNQQTEQDNDMDEEERYGGVIGTGGLAIHHAKTGGTAALLAAARAESGGLGSGSRSPQTPTEFTHSSSGGSSGGAYRPPAVRKAEATQHAAQQAKHQLQDVLSGKLKSSNTTDGVIAATAASDTTDSSVVTRTASVSEIENTSAKVDSTSITTDGKTAAAASTTTGTAADTVDATADSKTTSTDKKETSDTTDTAVKKDSDPIVTTPTITTAKVASPSTATTTATSAASTPTTTAAAAAKKSTLTLNAKAKEFKPSGFKATAKEFVPGVGSVTAINVTSSSSTIMSPPPLHTTGTVRRNSISSHSANVSPTPGHHTPTHHHQQQHTQQHGGSHSGGHQQHHQQQQQHHTSPHHTAIDHNLHHQQHLQQQHHHVPGMVVDPNMVR